MRVKNSRVNLLARIDGVVYNATKEMKEEVSADDVGKGLGQESKEYLGD